MEYDTEYDGHDMIPLLRVFAKDTRDCADFCGETPGCSHWTYHLVTTDHVEKMCYLKTSDSGRRGSSPSFPAISGNKECGKGQ